MTMIDERLARGAEFNRYDRRFLSWIPREAAQRGVPRDFDLDRSLAVIEEIRQLHPFEREPFFEQRSSAMTLREARFWFYARTGPATRWQMAHGASDRSGDGGRQQILEAAHRELRSIDFDRAIDVEVGVTRIAKYEIQRSLLLPLGHIFTCEQLLRMMHALDHIWLKNTFADGIARFVVPYLDAADFARLQAAVIPIIENFIADQSQYAHRPARSTPHDLLAEDREWSAAIPPEIALCPALHLPDLAARAFGLLMERRHRSSAGAFAMHGLVLGHASASEVQQAGEQTQLRFADSGALREWLAATGDAGLAHARRYFNDQDNADLPARVAALGMLGSAGAARAMLDVTLRKHADPAARAWLLANMKIALPVLANAAATRSRAGDVAVELLRAHAASGHQADVERGLSADLREVVFGPSRSVVDLAWLDVAPKRVRRLPWLYADALPALELPGRTIGEEQIPAIAEALRASTLAAIDPRLAALRAVAEPASAERWALALFRQWLRANAPVEDRWAMFALGWFGGDQTGLALVPFIRRWPGESQHARAVIGLEILQMIGTDLALTQIAGLAQRLPFAALKRRAAECIEALAAARNLSRERLEDRIIPTLDFQPSGERSLPFRGTAYRIRLQPDLSARLVDHTGRAVRDLPKPPDDEPDAIAERAEWMSLKKQLRELSTIQRARLERAMVAQRAWFADEFQTFIVDHPLVGKLARGLVWVVDALDGSAKTFSIEADGFAGVDAVGLVLPPSGAVRIAHRLDLGERELERWEARFAERVQPFAQLDRVTYRLDPAELREPTITRFGGSSVPEVTFISRLKQRDWLHGPPADGGMYSYHVKYFERADVHAVLSHGGIIIGYRQPDARVGEIACAFYRKEDADPMMSQRDRLPLHAVDPVAISEVVADLAFVVGG